MSEQPNHHHDGDDFDAVISANYAPGPAYIDPTPYGQNPAAQGAPAKAGMTKRGKTVLAVGGTVLAVGSLMFWQHNESVTSANEARAAELAIQQQKIELEKLKVMGEQNTKATKAAKTAQAARQKLIDGCVQDNKGLVGKQLGATLSSVIEDCQVQYPDTNAGADMQAAAASEDASGGGGDGIGTVSLVIGGVLVVGVVLGTRKVTRGNQQPAYGPTYY